MFICNDRLKHELKFESNELKPNGFVQIRPVRTYLQIATCYLNENDKRFKEGKRRWSKYKCW